MFRRIVFLSLVFPAALLLAEPICNSISGSEPMAVLNEQTNELEEQAARKFAATMRQRWDGVANARGKERDALAAKLSRQRRQFQAEFDRGAIGFLYDAAPEAVKTQRIDPDSPACAAAQLLAEWRTPGAEHVLAPLVAVRLTSFSPISNEWYPHWYSYPFAVALSKLGTPSLSPLLEHIRKADPTSTRFHVSCLAIEAMLGKPAARALIEESLDSNREPRKSGRLESAVALVDKGHKRWDARSAADHSSQ